jgi:hypothetical protein
MEKEQLAEIPREDVHQLLRRCGYDWHSAAIIESALVVEWWRGFYAACDIPKDLLDAAVTPAKRWKR